MDFTFILGGTQQLVSKPVDSDGQEMENDRVSRLESELTTFKSEIQEQIQHILAVLNARFDKLIGHNERKMEKARAVDVEEGQVVDEDKDGDEAAVNPPKSSPVLPAMEQPVLEALVQGDRVIPMECGVAFGQPLIKWQSNVLKKFSQCTISVENIAFGLAIWPPIYLGALALASNTGVLNTQNRTMALHPHQW